MKLSRKSEYACLALIDLAEHDGAGPIKAADVSQRKGIPKKYLNQILLQLSRSGYVRGTRGAGGGYKLAKPAGKITVAQIIRLMDGPLAPVGSVSRHFYQHTPIEKSRKLAGVLRDIRNYISEKLEKTTFADLV